MSDKAKIRQLEARIKELERTIAVYQRQEARVLDAIKYNGFYR